MATWYVRTTGSDSAAGTSAATAFLTIGKAMTQASLAAGDTIYVGAGTYRVSTTIAPTSMASMTYLYGDTDGSKTGDAGEVIVTNFATNDTTAASACNLFTFASKNYWTLGKLTLMQGYQNTTTSEGIYITGTSANLTFQDLTVYAYGNGIYATSLTFGTVLNWVVERCRIWGIGYGGQGAIRIDIPGSASGSHVDANVVIRNNVLFGLNTVYTYNASATTYRTGGFTVSNNFVSPFAGGYGVLALGAGNSTTYPMKVYNNHVNGAGGGLYAASSTMMTEDYNVLVVGQTVRSNVTAGANSISNGARNWRFSMGHEASFGAVTRPFGEFPSGSPLLTWGGTAVPTDDINGVTRPASGAAQTTTQQALGPYERANSATKETTTTRTGGTAIKIAGPGYQDFELAVSPAATNVSVYSYKDAAYGTAATGPQLIIANAGEAGFGGTTITSAGGTGAWAAMTATFTPTSAGIVTVRLQSNATVGSANVYFDDFSVS